MKKINIKIWRCRCSIWKRKYSRRKIIWSRWKIWI